MPKGLLILFVFVGLTCASTMRAQTDTLAMPPPPEEMPVDEIVSHPEVQPDYAGGMEALMKFITRQITYPNDAKDNKLQGKVYVSYVVEVDGSVSNVSIARGITGAKMLDEEAIRVVKKIRYAKPAFHNGVPVRSKMIIPIKFALQ